MTHADLQAQENDPKYRLKLWLKVLRTSRAIEIEMRNRFRREFNTTLPRFDVMAALYQTPKGTRMSALSDALMVSNGNVTGLVDRLVKEGFIIKIRDEKDGRATLVRLTRKGLETFETMAKAHEQWINDLLHDVSLKEANEISNQLEKVRIQPKGNL